MYNTIISITLSALAYSSLASLLLIFSLDFFSIAAFRTDKPTAWIVFSHFAITLFFLAVHIRYKKDYDNHQ